jgi:large subunit ribosomal protein L10
MVKEEKLKAVETLREELKKSPVIAMVDMHKTPSKQLQEIRRGLRGKARLWMVKKVILKFAIDGMKKENIKKLEELMPKQPAIIFSDIGAFKLYALVNNLRFKTFAKEGDVAKEDIWISAGPTSLMAGPAISEFQQAGLSASIESGKIIIRKGAYIVKAGEAISAVKANALRKLKIEPMEVVLNVVSIYENGDVYPKDDLKLVTEFPRMLPQAFNNALNLSVFIVFPIKENIKYLLARASRAAQAIKGLAGIERQDEKKEELPEKAEPTDEVKEVPEKQEEKEAEPQMEDASEKGGVE